MEQGKMSQYLISPKKTLYEDVALYLASKQVAIIHDVDVYQFLSERGDIVGLM